MKCRRADIRGGLNGQCRARLWRDERCGGRRAFWVDDRGRACTTAAATTRPLHGGWPIAAVEHPRTARPATPSPTSPTAPTDDRKRASRETVSRPPWCVFSPHPPNSGSSRPAAPRACHLLLAYVAPPPARRPSGAQLPTGRPSGAPPPAPAAPPPSAPPRRTRGGEVAPPPLLICFSPHPKPA